MPAARHPSMQSAEAARADQELDLKGLVCPLPILKAKVALKAMEPDRVLHVHTTDPMSVVDFRVFCMRAGHALLSWVEHDGHFEFFIRRTADDA